MTRRHTLTLLSLQGRHAVVVCLLRGTDDSTRDILFAMPAAVDFLL